MSATVTTSKGRTGELVRVHSRPSGGRVYHIRFGSGAFTTVVPFLRRGLRSRPVSESFGSKEYIVEGVE